MPAFSWAIAVSVSPRNFSWSSETEVITVAQRVADDIGRVEPAAEPDFEEEEIGRMAGEHVEGGRRGDLELGDRRAGIDFLGTTMSASASSSLVDEAPAPGAG